MIYKLLKTGETGKITIDSVDYTPVYCYDRGAGSNNRYELIDIRSAINEYDSGDKSKINTSLYNTLKKELSDIEKVLGDPITNNKTDVIETKTN